MKTKPKDSGASYWKAVRDAPHHKVLPELPHIEGYQWFDVRRPDGPYLAELRSIKAGELRGFCREAKQHAWQTSTQILWVIVTGRTLDGVMQPSKTFEDVEKFATEIR